MAKTAAKQAEEHKNPKPISLYDQLRHLLREAEALNRKILRDSRAELEPKPLEVWETANGSAVLIMQRDENADCESAYPAVVLRSLALREIDAQRHSWVGELLWYDAHEDTEACTPRCQFNSMFDLVRRISSNFQSNMVL